MVWGTDGGRENERPRRGRRLTLILSVILHALAGTAAVAYSFWHVEELSPSTVTVTFVSAAAAPPAPPPPPAPPGGAAAPAASKRRAGTAARQKPELPPKTPELVAPVLPSPVKVAEVERPKEALASETPRQDVAAGSTSGAGVSGVAGGVKGGVAGGSAQLKVSGAEPDFPANLRRPGANFLVMAKICVGITGGVESVTLLKRAEPALDVNVVSTVKGWRFRPMTANNTPVPFCYFGRFEFKSD
jgi:outer membrane biosynthesis protein TonB